MSKKKPVSRKAEAIAYCTKRWPFSSVAVFTTAVEAYLAGVRHALREPYRWTYDKNGRLKRVRL